VIRVPQDAGAASAGAQDYDIVLKGGRVMDPETQLDAVMNVGIKGDIIATVTAGVRKGVAYISLGASVQIRLYGYFASGFGAYGTRLPGVGKSEICATFGSFPYHGPGASAAFISSCGGWFDAKAIFAVQYLVIPLGCLLGFIKRMGRPKCPMLWR